MLVKGKLYRWVNPDVTSKGTIGLWQTTTNHGDAPAFLKAIESGTFLLFLEASGDHWIKVIVGDLCGWIYLGFYNQDLQELHEVTGEHG